MIETLLRENSRNIVRLILPRMVSDPVTADDPYHRAAKLLRRWRSKEVLTTDRDCALYVYEYGDDGHRVCGLVGALDLQPPDAGVVLPHEDVIAGIVADRLAMMTASEANLEPILLVYDGAGATREVIDKARASVPLVDVAASDGTTHRLWAITDEAELAMIRTPSRPPSGPDRRRAPPLRDLSPAAQAPSLHRRRPRAVGPRARPAHRPVAMAAAARCDPPQHLRAAPRRSWRHRTGSSSDDATPVGDEATAPVEPGHLVLTDGTHARTLRLIETRGSSGQRRRAAARAAAAGVVGQRRPDRLSPHRRPDRAQRPAGRRHRRAAASDDGGRGDGRRHGPARSCRASRRRSARSRGWASSCVPSPTRPDGASDRHIGGALRA